MESQPQTENVYITVIAEGLSQILSVDSSLLRPLVTVPPSTDLGHYCVSAARVVHLKGLKGNPKDFAATWAKEFPSKIEIESVTSKDGYINFRLNQHHLSKEVLHDILTKEGYGKEDIGCGKNIVIDFSSPNIAKPFHAGHLRSTIIGNFIKHIHKAFGYNVVAINYLGDWGKQYGLLAVGFQMFGSEEELQKNPIQHLFEVYVKINKLAKEDPSLHDKARHYFSLMETGKDEHVLSLWRRFRELSIEEYKRIYKRLNIEFDVYSGESLQASGAPAVIETMKEKNILKESHGAQVVDLNEWKLNSALVMKKDGTTLYLTRDIVAAKDRIQQYDPKHIFYVVAAAQSLHFQQLWKILELMGYDWYNRCSHISFGMVKGMSTRTGEVVFLQDILECAKTCMLEHMKANESKFAELDDPEGVADIVGVSAVIVQDMMGKRGKDYAFDWARITKFEGNTGPYLQYTHARMCAIEEKAGMKLKDIAEIDLSLLTESEALEVVLLLKQYPAILRQVLDSLEPCHLLTYLFKLCHSISAAHSVLWVKGKEESVAQARLALFVASRKVLNDGMKILGLLPVERM